MNVSDKLLLCTVFTKGSCASQSHMSLCRYGLPLLILAVVHSFGVAFSLAQSWCLCSRGVPAFCQSLHHG